MDDPSKVGKAGRAEEPEVEGHMIATDVVLGPEKVGKVGSHEFANDPSKVGKAGSPEDVVL
jgi:hypothetical protein